MTATMRIGAPAEQKLERILALLCNPSRPAPAIFRIKAQAIYEGIEFPADRKEFLALAARAGIGATTAYRLWGEEARPEASRPVAVRVYGKNRNVYWVAPVTAAEVEETIDSASQPTDLYRWYDEMNVLLYAGISDRLTGRAGAHSAGSTWMEFAVRPAIERYPSRTEAEDAEEAAIKAEHPIFNDRHNDTPEARKRAVEYLISRNRLDLLAPVVSKG